jgi:hypothetical protein
MRNEWFVQQMRLSIFSAEPLSVSDSDWRTITEQNEAEGRISIPGGKMYSGRAFGGVLSFAYSGTRVDVILSTDEAAARPEGEIPCVAKWVDLPSLFIAKVSPFLEGYNLPINRIALGSILLLQAASREATYEKLGEFLRSVKVDPVNSRELIYRINWPQKSQVIPDLDLNRITNWSSVAIARNLLQLAGAEITIAQTGEAINAVRLEIDHNTSESWKAPFAGPQRVSILRELISLADANANAGERP